MLAFMGISVDCSIISRNLGMAKGSEHEVILIGDARRNISCGTLEGYSLT